MLPQVAFLNHMAITFIAIVIIMTVITAIKPLTEPVKLPVREDIDVTPSSGAKFAGIAIIVITIILYVVFW